jgi:hypothetical protein
MNWLAVLIGFGITLGMAGCSNPSMSVSPQMSPATLQWFADHGYHTGPYDNTGNGPGETGMEGGGG